MKKITPDESLSHSAEIVTDNIEQLRAFFPESFTEGKIDFEVLRQLLGGVVDEREEKYGLNWHGKRKARQLALTPSTGTLRPFREESIAWDTTQNLMIEGDNLEALKLLQRSFSGKVKMIYIDPPYNTGKDFVYPDDFHDNIKNYQMLVGQVDTDGRQLTSNTDASGRFHTNWLSMIYPRLKIARNLLRDDGVIFVSIDDNEVENLRKVLSEIFGEENFCCQFVWNTEGNTDNQYTVKVNHEYVVAFYKDASESESAIGRVVDPNTPEGSNLWKGIADNNINKNNPENPPAIVELPIGFPCSEEELFYSKKNIDDAFFKQTKSDGFISDAIKAKYSIEHKSGLPIKLDDLIVKNFKLTKPCRVYGGMANRNKLLEFIGNGCQPIDDDGTPLKFYLNVNAGVRYTRENEKPRNILSVLRGFGTTEKTKTYLKSIGIYYDYAKPLGLIEYLIKIGCEGDGIVLDFFAGSATTAEAVINLNHESGTKRRFICVQLPDRCSQEGSLRNGGVTTLSDIAKRRIKAILDLRRRDTPLFSGDLGFRVFKLDASNIQTWDPDRENLEQSLLDSIDHIKPDRSEDDVLYELLLKLGLDLCVPIEQRKIAGKTVHSIGAGVLLVCLSEEISRDDVEALAHGMIAWHKELAPSGETTIVFRDSGFQHKKKSDDVAKTNITEILKQHGLKNIRSL